MADSIVVSLKAQDKSYNHSFPLTSMDNVSLSHDDKTLQRMVEEAQKNCKVEAEKITIKATFIW